jgi:2-hydroxychromene-2-carboxylate isomerase
MCGAWGCPTYEVVELTWGKERLLLRGLASMCGAWGYPPYEVVELTWGKERFVLP